MKTLLTLIILACMTGCISVTISDPELCSFNFLGTVPGVPAASALGTLPAITLTETVDMSASLQKIDDVANKLTIAVQSLTLVSNQNTNWIQSVQVSVNSQTLATYTRDADAGPSSDQVVFTVVMPADQLEPLLMAGPVPLTFTIVGSVPGQDNDMSVNFCISVSGEIQK